MKGHHEDQADYDPDGFAGLVHRAETALRNGYRSIRRLFDPVTRKLQSVFGRYWIAVVALVGATVLLSLKGLYFWIGLWILDVGGLIGVAVALFVVLMVVDAVRRD